VILKRQYDEVMTSDRGSAPNGSTFPGSAIAGRPEVTLKLCRRSRCLFFFVNRGMQGHRLGTSVKLHFRLVELSFSIRMTFTSYEDDLLALSRHVTRITEKRTRSSILDVKSLIF
jgi:hypothetical protein